MQQMHNHKTTSQYATLQLIAYFGQTDNKEFTELEFKDHLDQVNKQFPHLCHIAGKHFKYLEEVFTLASNKYGVDNDQMNKVISNYAIRVHNPPQESKPVDESKVKLSTDVPQI